ncbi:MAG: DUF3488 domain-containing transglutaminase family protein [Aquabacterium sp.]|uniref:transglutaminase family protein n=1 Tax=Aquabacterium sp. TaxID=1872578 RepID=UPI0025C4BC3B|nr:DUF3488 and transglutaminase-like domain-containing protein [Aquabacterium sp.]MBI3381985.1 DUF3488 domain-containing transglutaminase family protein [Aquabacterium sp.]
MKRLQATAISREGRDNLLLLAVLALSILPHLPRLPLWSSISTVLAIVIRARLAWRDAPLPPRWILLVCLAAGMGMTVWTFHTLFGREAGITLVCLLAGLKTLELRARRDAFVVTSLGFFLILTQFLYSQSLFIAALMLVVLMGMLTSLVLAQRPMGRPTIWSAVKIAWRSVLMGIPVMLALYVLFPRLGPLWSVPADAGPRTGLSDRIKLGHVAELAQDDSVAMRVKFIDVPPVTAKLYFRGPVLDYFDGRNWVARPRAQEPVSVDDVYQPTPVGAATRYQVTLEPSKVSTVPLLDGTLMAGPTPPLTEPRLERDGLNWTSSQTLADRTQIDAQAWLTILHGPKQGTPLLRPWLQLPAGFNPRTLAWAQALLQRPELANADPKSLSNAVLRHIRQGAYHYTMTPGEDGIDTQGRPVRDLIDHFWLDTREGFCEHYATAYVVIMRAMGIPSRVVTGYQGAEINPVDGLFVVRNSDAHAWAEFWQPGEGWVRVDPTGAVAPERIERPRQSAGNRGALQNALSSIDPAVWGRMRDYMDATNHRWNIWVLQYSRHRQMQLLKDWGMPSPNWMDLVRLCGIVIMCTSLLGIGWLWWTRPRTPRTPWRRPLMRVHRALQAAGLPPPEDSPMPAPAMTWAARIERLDAPEPLQPVKQALIDALRQLDALRYAPHQGSTRQARQLRTALIQTIQQQAQQWRAIRRRDRAN